MMKVNEILQQYPDTALDKISSDKIDETVNLRLPRTVIIQEITEALNSLTYVAKALAPTRPPTYAIFKLLLESPDYSAPIDGFQEKVMAETEEMTQKAISCEGLSSDKNYQLYLIMLTAAWEDGLIERGEALLLQTLREELDIWTREHLLLEHHPDINILSDFSNTFVTARNHLLLTGLVLTFDNNYILAEEVALQIKRAWGIELETDDYKRLLEAMTKQQLYTILEKTGLQVSGSKDDQIQRIITALVPPAEALGFLHIDELRELARRTDSQISGLKAEVITNMIGYFDQDKDLEKDEEKEPCNPFPDEPEARELENLAFAYLLKQLSNDQLYDLLSTSFLKTSGTKEIKISRLVESPWSERSILNGLRRIELSNLCRKLAIQTSGVKSELLDRVMEWAAIRANPKFFSKDAAQEQETVNTGITPDLDQLKGLVANALPVPGLHDIEELYPFLDKDEQVILSLINETKSLTEQDIERASLRHGFQWFLTKAHMAEMVAKLKQSGNLPLRVKSVSSINIYQWLGNKEQLLDETEKLAARNVIDALRQGVVPEKGLNLLAVGQENTRDHLIELISEIHSGKSAFKFIRGQYGAGKTFLCSWLRQYALDNEYIVSLINIGPDQPLSDLPVFYAGIINGLRTPEKRDSSALADVLESWLLAVHRKTAQIEGLSPFDDTDKEKLMPLVEERIESELAALSNIEPGFAPVLRAFYHARTSGDQITASNAIAWLSGSHSIPTKALNEIGVRGYLEANQVFHRMRALLEIIAGSRFKGLLLMVDELELIRRFPHSRQREQALETLRLLIDETGKNGFPGCLLIFTGTDEFFEDDRAGLKSYGALAERVAAPGGPNGIVSVRQPVILLEGLNRERLHTVIEKVRDIHGTAYSWESKTYIPDDFVERLIHQWTSFGNDSISRKPRPVLKELINILDVCEENRGVDLNGFFGVPMSNTTMSTELGDIFSE